MFWAWIFLGVGLVLLLESVLGISIPIFKVLVGLGFVYFGISMIMGGFHMRPFESRKTHHQAIFAESDFNVQNQEREFHTVFGKSKMDLTGKDYKSTYDELKVDTVFGDCEILIKKGTPWRVTSTTVFGGAMMPGKNINAFGTFTQQSSNFEEGKAGVSIKADTVFGKLQIIEVE